MIRETEGAIEIKWKVLKLEYASIEDIPWTLEIRVLDNNIQVMQHLDLDEKWRILGVS